MVSMLSRKAVPISARSRATAEHPGFTLMEMMTVIGVIAILCALAIPAYISWLPRYRLNSAADELLSVLQQAKLRAIKENANVVVDFDPDDNGNPDGRFTVFVDNGIIAQDSFNPINRNNNFQDGQENTILTGGMSKGIDLDEVQFNGNLKYTRFTNRGHGFNGHIYLINQQGDFQGIITTMTGNIRKTKSK